jgi:hypothetical protein
MPRERRSLQGEVITNKANWTNEEVISWLDNNDRKKQEVYNTLESEFIGNGGRQVLGSSREIWSTNCRNKCKGSRKVYYVE